ncbi:hypothetical protein I551_2228 [Mycobacterium ulcerans str. Harvey]|nr:hypothetical protein I551_2228 [Mycobacterium ulcerans str. Harvey]
MATASVMTTAAVAATLGRTTGSVTKACLEFGAAPGLRRC